MKKFFKIFLGLIMLLTISFISYVGWKLYPHENLKPLPEDLIAFDSNEGKARLERASKSDYDALVQSYSPQATISYCGVASSVTLLKAFGKDESQFSFFNNKTDQVKSRMAVTLGGMTLLDLTSLLQAHDLKVRSVHGDAISLEHFRQEIIENLSDQTNYLLVNYQREVLGQGRVGHISPVGAYDENSDSLLILDTAAHKYPYTWVPVARLYDAMQDKDSDSGKARGYVSVSL